MDTPSSESNALTVDGAAQVFSAMLEPQPTEELKEDTAAEETPPVAEPEAPAEPEAAAQDDEGVTIEVDGKTVKLSKAELAEAYKSGLRQSDYTKKTMEVAEQKKAAQAEIERAHAERQEYAINLNRMQAQLEGALQEQAKTDWEALLQSDPVEYLKQQHLFQQRQAALQQNYQQQKAIAEQTAAERQKAMQSHVQEQQEQLLAKLPEWKDAAKAQAEKTALTNYLLEQGYEKDAVGNITDHKAVILARKAMLFDQMMAKASAATKKVSAAPQRTVKPGVADNGDGLDKRTAAFKQLSKTGRVEDAAALFAQIL